MLNIDYIIFVLSILHGEVPEWPKGADCKSVALASMVQIHSSPPIEKTKGSFLICMEYLSIFLKT